MAFDSAAQLRKIFEDAPGDLPSAALHYASNGIMVFPVAVDSTVPLISSREGGHGYLDATCDLDRVRAWWTAWPKANIGLRTGVQFDVLDLDLKNGNDGPSRWAEVTRDGGFTEPVAWVEKTPHGLHFYLPEVKDVTRKAPVHDDWRGVDYLGKGGYVVAYPSVANEAPYVKHGPFTTPYEQTYSKLDVLLGRAEESTSGHVTVDIEVMEPGSPGTKYGLKALNDEFNKCALCGAGGRNLQMYKSACALGELVAGKQLDYDVVVEWLYEAARLNGLIDDPDDGPNQTLKTIYGGLAKGQESPRDSETYIGLPPAPAPKLPPSLSTPVSQEMSIPAAPAWVAADQAARGAAGIGYLPVVPPETVPAPNKSVLPPPEDIEQAQLDRFAKDVADGLYARRVRQEISRQWAALEQAQKSEAKTETLRHILENRSDLQWRVKNLLPMGTDTPSSTMVVAAAKTGKTTLMVNLLRSLMTGDPLFSTQTVVNKIEGSVMYLNYEVTRDQLGDWFLANRLPPSCFDRMLVRSLRGQANPFNSEMKLAELAVEMREAGTEVLVVDTFSRAYTGESQNDAAEVGAWLVKLDQLAAAAGVSDVYLVHHSGHDVTRSRGSSALNDWPDAILVLAKGDISDGNMEPRKNPDALRVLSGEGRDVFLPWHYLLFEDTTKHLTLKREDEMPKGGVLPEPSKPAPKAKTPTSKLPLTTQLLPEWSNVL